MAKIVKRMPEANSPGRRRLSVQYLDGQAWELEPGVDFETDHVAKERAIRSLAKSRGLLVSVIQRDGKLYVQARPRPAQTEARIRVAK